MILANIKSTVVAAEIVFAAGLDYSGIGSIIAGATATVALILGYRTSKRTADTTEEVSYVDTNLKTMQATLEWLKADNERLMIDNRKLRDQNEEQNLQNLRVSEELRQITLELTQCKDMCGAMDRKLKELGEGNAKQ